MKRHSHRFAFPRHFALCCGFFLFLALGSARALAQNQTVSGSLTVGGAADVQGNTFSFGSWTGNASAVGETLTYSDLVTSGSAAGPAQFIFGSGRNQHQWYFQRPSPDGTIWLPAMKLDGTNALSLYNPVSPYTATIVLNPASGQITVNGLPVMTGNTGGTGVGSVVSGSSTTATGAYSVANGIGTTAQAYDSFVLGRYNLISGATNSWTTTDPLFVIGNGSSTSARANAFTVLKNGNVGIGIANPAFLFQFSASANQSVGSYVPTAASGITDYSAPGVGFQFSRPSDGGFVHALYTYGAPNGDQNLVASARASFVITTGNGMQAATEKLRVTAAGNVGIGTPNPLAPLHVGPETNVGGNAPTAVITKTASGETTLLMTRVGQSSGVIGLDGSNVLNVSSETGKGGIDFRTGGIYQSGLADTAASRVRILDNGNVGVGTVAPAAKLEVQGAAKVDGGFTVTGSNSLVLIPKQGDLDMGPFTAGQQPQ